jgi:hypothetical protein
MKKLLLSTLCICLFGSVKSQTLLSENFDSGLNWTVNHITGTSTNSGWTQVSTDSNVESNNSATPFSGAGMARFDSYLTASNNSYSLTSPAIAFNGASYTVKFRMFVSGQFPTADKLEVFYNTTSSLTGATSLGSVQRRLLYADNQPGWYTYIFEIPGTPAGNGYISFVGTSGYGYSFDVDEIVIGVKNTCAPSALINVSSITNTSGLASWTSTGASNYEYVVDNTNGDPLSAATKTTTSLSYAPLSGLTPNTTYFLHVRSSCSGTSKGEWKTVIFKTLQAPSNDVCANAISLTPSSHFDDNYTTGTNLGSDTSSGFSTVCSTTINSDVWYKAVIPASGSLTFETAAVTGSTLTNTLIGVYSGACGSLSQITCNGNASIATNFGKATITGRTPGEVVYVGVWNTGYSSTNGEFKIEAYDASLAPANDLCAGAVTLIAGNNFNTNTKIGTTLNAFSPATSTSCGANFDVWYKALIPASGSLTIETASVSGSALTDTKMGVFSGNCGALTNIACNDDIIPNTNLFSKISLTGRTPGEIIYITVYNYSNSTLTNGEFKVAAYDASITLATDTFDLTKFSFYPNPVEDILNLDYSESISTVQVINILGQTVLVKNANSNNSQINLSSLPSGNYFVKLTSGSLTQTIKILKK